MRTFDIRKRKKRECGKIYQSGSVCEKADRLNHGIQNDPGVRLLATMSSEYISLLFARKDSQQEDRPPALTRDFKRASSRTRGGLVVWMDG